MVYEGSGGNVLYEYKGGLIDSSKGPILLFGNGTEDENAASGFNRVNGVTQFQTGATVNDSVGLATPTAWRGRSEQNDIDREANGTLVAKLRAGFPARDDMHFFFGVLDEDPGASRTVETILTTAAGGAITSVESDFAGFYYTSELTNDTDRWRCVAVNSGGGNKDASKAPVMTPHDVESNAQYMNVSRALSPTLSVEVSYDGTVDFFYNGDLVRRAVEGVDPEKHYCALFVLQTDEAVLKRVGVDYFCAEWQRFFGPIFS